MFPPVQNCQSAQGTEEFFHRESQYNALTYLLISFEHVYLSTTVIWMESGGILYRAPTSAKMLPLRPIYGFISRVFYEII